MTELINHYLRNDSNLVSYWQLNNSVVDYKGLNNGTNSPTFVDGKFGKCLSSNMTLPANSYKYTTENFSISCWVKTVNKSTAQLSIFFNDIINSGDYSGYSLEMYLGNIRFNTFPSNGTPTSNITTSSTTMNDDEWHFIVATKNGTTGKIYIDSIERASGTNNNPSYDATHNPGIGSSSSHYVDDLAIFTKALTQTEIFSLYNSYKINRAIRPRPFAPGIAR